MTNEFIENANQELATGEDDLMTFEEFLDRLNDNPALAADATQYLLNAIEYAGTRTVIEQGEELNRWQFFDDPWNDGEHAVLGNTRMLNQFVEDLRQLSADFGREDQMMWFGGPTATGKSELKRCIVNGLREYSKTEEGRRYTCEWNIETRSTDARAFDSADSTRRQQEDDDNWYQSPVQTNPLSVLPQSARQNLLSSLAEEHEDIPRVQEDIDPFSHEAYRFLRQYYKGSNQNDLFEQITAPEHLRVSRYTVDVGQGIGVLHSEDDGSPKERLVGSWMPQMLGKLESRGRKNPQAFSYDGVLAQGNSGVTIVEDASQHADLLQKLLNIPEEGMVKLDNKIGMDLDTLILIISNPDLDATLNQQSSAQGADPLKPLKRRLDKYEFSYLTNLSLEVELIRRELMNDKTVWTNNEEERIPDPLAIEETELAPHVIEAAAMYEVVTRIDENKPDDFSFVDKALLLDRGYHRDENGERHEREEYDEYTGRPAKDHGIPVTYTRDVLASLVQQDDVILPQDVLAAMYDQLENEPMFSAEEIQQYQSRFEEVEAYIRSQQEEDVIAAIMRGKRADEKTLNEYVEQVFGWGTDDDSIDVDPLKMKVFETEYLGFDEDDDYSGTDPSDEIEDFRRTEVINRLGKYAWRNRDDDGDFNVENIEIRETPVLGELLGSYSWDDVQLAYPNIEPNQWADPQSGTETETVREKCIKNMQEMFGYSEESALQTSKYVFEHSDYSWD